MMLFRPHTRTKHDTGITTPLTVILCVLSLALFPVFAHALTATIGGAMIDLGGFIFEIGKGMFLQSIKWTILEFSTYWDGAFGANLKNFWQLIRDVVNLTIVVLFVLTAILFIFGRNFKSDIKILLFLLAAALLVNFSAFFTLALFDISHALFGAIFNLFDATAVSNLSPFSEYGKEFLDIDPDAIGWNIFYPLVILVTSVFLFMGFFWFCIILLERFIIAFFLIISSPIAVLGFFLSLGGGKSFATLSEFYTKHWRAHLVRVLLTPVLLITGFLLLMLMYVSIHKSILDPKNLTSQGAGGWEFLLPVVLTSALLIIGMFKLGHVVRKIEYGNFKIGEKIYRPINSAFKVIGNPLTYGRAGVGFLRHKTRDHPQPAVFRRISERKEGVQDFVSASKSIIAGKPVPDDLRNRKEKRDAERRVRREGDTIAKTGDFEEKVRFSRGRMTPNQFNTLIEDPGLLRNLAGNTYLAPKQIDTIIDRAMRTGNNDALEAAVKNPQASVAALNKVLAGRNINDNVRSAAMGVLQKHSGVDVKELTDADKVSIVKKLLQDMAEGEKEAKDAAVESLKRHAKGASERVSQEIINGFGENLPEPIFTELIKDVKPRVIDSLLNRDYVKNKKEFLEKIYEEARSINNGRIADRVKKMIDAMEDRTNGES